MNRRPLLFGLALLALLLGLAACGPKEPAAQVDNPSFDFGTIEQDATASHTYVIKNVGRKQLQIKRTHTTCGCTVAQPSKTALEPGDTANIEVTFSAGRRSGPQTKRITVETNDPKNPKTILTITGKVAQRLAAVPERFHFENMAPGKTETQTMTITNSGQGPVTINGFKAADAEAVNCKLDFKGNDATPFTMQEKEEFKLTCTLTMPKDKPYYHSRLELDVEGPNKKPLPIYIAGRAKDSKAVVKKAGDAEAGLSPVSVNFKKVQKVQKKDK